MNLRRFPKHTANHYIVRKTVDYMGRTFEKLIKIETPQGKQLWPKPKK